MRFRVVNHSSKNGNCQKSEEKDTQTRQTSGNKYSRQNSFKQMVKNSIEFHLSIGKEKLKQQSMKYAIQKQQALKKLIKKQKIREQRQIQNENKLKENPNELKKILNRIKRKQYLERKQQKQLLQPTRKSQRNGNHISYCEIDIKKQQKSIFDVLNIEENHILDIQQNNRSQIKIVENFNHYQDKRKNDSLEKMIPQRRVAKAQQQLKLQDQGTYQIGVAHQALLRAQKCIDEHINFKHQIRQIRFVEVSTIVKYLKSHGFSTFNQNEFKLLIKINPYLYSLTQSMSQFNSNVMTFKLNDLEIQKRLQSTKRRMTQLSIPQLFT